MTSNRARKNLDAAKDRCEIVVNTHWKGDLILRTLFVLVVCVSGFCVGTLQAQSHWQDADLTAITAGPNANGTIAIAFDPMWGGMRTHYIASADLHVHELFLSGGHWQDADLTAITGGPSAFGYGIAISFDPAWNGMRTHYVAADLHVHELFLSGGQWQDADLTAITGGPSAYGTIAIAFDPVWGGMRTHYVARPDFHVHELFLSGSQWQDADLTAITGGASDFGSGIAISFDPAWNGMRTHYVAADLHVHELFLSGSQWHEADLTAGGPSANNGSIAMGYDPAWNGMRTDYEDADGHVHELFLSGSQWQDADLTALTGGPSATGSIAIAFDPVWNSMRRHYEGADLHVHELFLSGGQWQDADLTAIAGGPSAFGTIAMAFDPVWGGMRTHYGGAADLHMHELFLVP
jgi:hypothetical protein